MPDKIPGAGLIRYLLGMGEEAAAPPRPGYGLSTATGIGPQQKSLYEPTLRPGETRGASEVQDMLANIILAAGSTVATNPRAPSSAGRAYHGTRSNKPLRREPGLHVGTPEQAAARIRDPLTGTFPEGAKIHPLEVTPRKVATIRDLGNAMGFPVNMAQELVRTGVFTPAEASSVRSTADVYGLLRSKGYDAIKYENTWEGPGASYEIINPEIVSPAYSKRGAR